MATKPTLDLEILASLRELDQPGQVSIIQQLGELFLQSTPKHLQNMSKCLGESKLKAIRETAHQLKSSAGNMGAAQLSLLSSELEKLSDADSLEKYQSVVSLIEKEFDQVKKALSEQMGKKVAS
jgi:HPt (histidine-containing phosphotransfer) domain-containing protein